MRANIHLANQRGISFIRRLVYLSLSIKTAERKKKTLQFELVVEKGIANDFVLFRVVYLKCYSGENVNRLLLITVDDNPRTKNTWERSNKVFDYYKGPSFNRGIGSHRIVTEKSG